MRRRTKVLALLFSLPPVMAITTFCFLDADSTGQWPKEKTWMQLMAADTAEQAVQVFGRDPDIIIPPNPGAKNGIAQWIWTNNRRTDWEVTQDGWVKVYVPSNHLIFEIVGIPNEPLLLTWARKARERLEPTGINVDGVERALREKYEASMACCFGANRIALSGSDRVPPTYETKAFLDAKAHLTGNGITKIGEIKIVGNEITCDHTILRLTNLKPGQPLSEAPLKHAQQALIDSGLFQVDREKETSPSICVIDPDGPSEFKDVLVQVNERK